MRISDWSSDVCSSDLLPYLAIDIHDMCHRVVDADRHVFPVGQEMHGDEIDLLQQLRETQPEFPHVGIGHRLLHGGLDAARSEEHTSELQSLMRISYAVFCLKKKTIPKTLTKKHLKHNLKIELET